MERKSSTPLEIVSTTGESIQRTGRVIGPIAVAAAITWIGLVTYLELVTLLLLYT